MSLEASGRNLITVCRGLACSEAHGAEVLKDWCTVLKLKEGEISADGEFTVFTQNCFGRCAVGPNIKINQAAHSGQRPGQASIHLESFHYPENPTK